MKNLLIVALSLIVLGALLIFGGYQLAGRRLEGFNSKGNEYVEKSYECKDDVDSVMIKEKSNHVIVQSGDTDKVLVTYYDKKDKELYNIREEKGKLSVVRNDVKEFNFFMIDFTEKATVITLPEDYEGELDLHNTSGGFEIHDVAGSTVNVENTSGGIELDNVKGEAISVKNSSGGIRLNDVESDTDVNVSNSSGSISLASVTAGGNVDAGNSSGGIKLEDLKAGGNINLRNTSGSIRGTIVGNKSDYKIRSEVTSGSSNLDDSDSGNRELNAKVTSGSIKIEFKD